MNKETEKTNFLFEVFAGEPVIMLVKINIERTKQSAKGVELIKAPLSVNGYLTDEDDSYYYLGSEPNQYDQAVRKDDVLHVEIYQDIPEELTGPTTPDNDTGYN
jgi:hypothetical protein